jgi:hypothetical protein
VRSIEGAQLQKLALPRSVDRYIFSILLFDSISYVRGKMAWTSSIQCETDAFINASDGWCNFLTYKEVSNISYWALKCIEHFAGNNFTGNLKWDLGGKSFTLGIIKGIKLAQGRLVELGTSYAEKTSIFNLEAAIKPHKDHRLTATYVTCSEDTLTQTAPSSVSCMAVCRQSSISTEHNVWQCASF